MMKFLIYVFVIILIVTAIIMVNYFINLSKKVERSKSVVDVYLKKRYDLIPNLVNTVKGYTKYEKATLDEIVKLRNVFNNTNGVEVGQKLNEHYKNLISLIENYPNIKANENFLQLQKSLAKVESEIQAARRIYINNITHYNTKIEIFPNRIFAKLFGFKKIELPNFIVEEIKINFN